MLQLRQEPAFGKKSKNSAKSKGQKDTHIALKKPAGHKSPVFQDFIQYYLCSANNRSRFGSFDVNQTELFLKKNFAAYGAAI